ncbi:hypothetical protein J2W36_004744 [Variovorax ginsengisoli]|uniref:Uncharacterized protein n=1 Tax=Variovorax ginsengisoli TaxID=363844 RepID=A0ABT9SGF6_9BURK|nr:hypothetical protein [Variovorax ginsengisoli]
MNARKLDPDQQFTTKPHRLRFFRSRGAPRTIPVTRTLARGRHARNRATAASRHSRGTLKPTGPRAHNTDDRVLHAPSTTTATARSARHANARVAYPARRRSAGPRILIYDSCLRSTGYSMPKIDPMSAVDYRSVSTEHAASSAWMVKRRRASLHRRPCCPAVGNHRCWPSTVRPIDGLRINSDPRCAATRRSSCASPMKR